MILTDKEIQDIVESSPYGDRLVETHDAEIAKAQLKKVVEWVIELNDFDEEEDTSPGAYYVISKNLWQSLLEEIE